MRRMAVLAPTLACALFLACAASAGAAGVVPAAGPWHALSAEGRPIAFEVNGGQVTNVQFRFRWGFCGPFDVGPEGSATIEADGHWKLEAGNNVSIEATFVAPDRAEGEIVALNRITPVCPVARTTFVAEPGAVPFEAPTAMVRANVRTESLANQPRTMVVRRDGSLRFYGLHWYEFNEPSAYATGHAYLRCRHCRGHQVRRRAVVVRLYRLTQQGDQRVYLLVHWALRGKLPPGFPAEGERSLG